MRRQDEEAEEGSGRPETIQVIHTTITIVTIIMKVIIKTTEVAEEVEVEAEAEAKVAEETAEAEVAEETAEAADTKENTLIRIIKTGRTMVIIITTQIRMRKTHIRVITNSNYLLLLRHSNNNRNSSNSSSNSSSNIRIATLVPTKVATSGISVGEMKQNYMSIPYDRSVNDRPK